MVVVNDRFLRHAERPEFDPNPGMPFQGACERGHHVAVEVRAHPRGERCKRSFGFEPLMPWPGQGQGVKGIAHRDDPRQERDLRTRPLIRIAMTIHPLVMVSDCFEGVVEEVNALEQGCTAGGVVGQLRALGGIRPIGPLA